MARPVFEIKDGKGNRKALGLYENADKRWSRRVLRQFWFRLGKDLKAEANRAVLDRGSKSGRVYIVRGPSGRRRRHQASAPGQSHANLSGTLRKSISWKIQGTHQMDFGYGLGTKPAPVYADAIELGRADGSIEPRPTIENAIPRGTARWRAHFDAVVAEEFKVKL